MTPVRTRFAPSPTGSLHVGGVRTALYCLLWARRTGGAFVLRIEDTDRVRSTDEAARGIVRDLRWLSLHWDEGPDRDHPQFGPYYQSQRLETYQRYARQLVDAGLAYEAWESTDELVAERTAAEAAKQNYRFHRRTYTDADLARFRAEGRKPVIRLAAPGHAVTVSDVILGDVTVEADGLDDFVLIKADGFPTYHFAVVIDDHLMEIGLVLRGQEHLMNTHKHLLLYEAFGWTPPAHGHLPLIYNPAGQKMSKREKAKIAREAGRTAAKAEGHPPTDWTWLADRAGLPPADTAAFMAKSNDGVATAEAIAAALQVSLPMIEVMDFRKGGYLPEAVVNYLALLGWSPGDDRELLSVAELLAAFELSRVNKTAARFDPDKLAWMNGEYMKTLPEDVLVDHLSEWIDVVRTPIADLDDGRRRLLLRMYRPRARTFRDLERLCGFVFTAPTAYDPKQSKKHLDPTSSPGGWSRLAAARGALGDVIAWEPVGIKASLDGLCAATGSAIGEFAQPIRIGLTGDGVSPDIADTLAILGKPEALARLDRLLALRPH
ncbi:MAG: glutamate--tRNA ligase [Myxococcota bacterium]